MKQIDYRADATYPDYGCNFETFTNEEMIEVEALGPLVTLSPGEATEHVEQWQLYHCPTPPPLDDAAAMARWTAIFRAEAPQILP